MFSLFDTIVTLLSSLFINRQSSIPSSLQSSSCTPQQTYTDCGRIVKVCTESNIIWAVAHSLRYDPHVVKILDIVEKGILGEMISIHHTNPVGSGGNDDDDDDNDNSDDRDNNDDNNNEGDNNDDKLLMMTKSMMSSSRPKYSR